LSAPPLPSMVTDSVICAIIVFRGSIVGVDASTCKPAVNSIMSGPELLLAKSIASKNEPGPDFEVEVTV